VIFGAGATRACGGPLTNEILPEALALRSEFGRKEHLDLLEQFLVQHFGLPQVAKRRADLFPPLPLVLSMVDTALDRDDAFGKDWPPSTLREVRGAIEYAIFALLELRLRAIRAERSVYAAFLRELYKEVMPESVTVVSMNYDLIADNTMSAVAERRGRSGLPDYRVDIATEAYRATPKTATLLKLHGSLNWLYCPNCHRLDLGIAESGIRTSKMLNQLYHSGVVHLGEEYEAEHSSPCPNCGTGFRPVLITPTHLKDYRNPHIARTWYEAERDLRQAKRAIFVGYGMPDDDVEVIYLFKRGLAALDADSITVVEYATGRAAALDRNPVGQRYRALFGDGIDWHAEGFEAWVADPRSFRPTSAGRNNQGRRARGGS
jgi:hypothetical protein